MPSPTAKPKTKSAGLNKLVLQQIRPYRKWVFLILAAMLVEALMGIASPWPLKIIIDNVIGSQPLPSWLHWINTSLIGRSKMALALATALLLVVITIIGALAGYVNSFYTESVGQYVANDTRLK